MILAIADDSALMQGVGVSFFLLSNLQKPIAGYQLIRYNVRIG